MAESNNQIEDTFEVCHLGSNNQTQHYRVQKLPRLKIFARNVLAIVANCKLR